MPIEKQKHPPPRTTTTNSSPLTIFHWRLRRSGITTLHEKYTNQCTTTVPTHVNTTNLFNDVYIHEKRTRRVRGLAGITPQVLYQHSRERLGKVRVSDVDIDRISQVYYR